jgi:dienelactone hydrolase
LFLVAAPFWSVLQSTGAKSPYGPYGPEGPRMREQLWIVPGADRNIPLRATVFRPSEIQSRNAGPETSAASERRPLVIINHGSAEATREAVAMPIFYWLSKWFVDRGYVVLVPQRRGFGATGGDLVEGRDRCDDPDHYGAGQVAADDIESALNYMARQPFVDASRTIVSGVSTGGWAALALAARNPAGVQLVVNFAGGRGGHAYGEPNSICNADRLVEAAGSYGKTARVPTLWLYAANDSYFGPDLATAMANAWKEAGGPADLTLLPAFGTEGHDIVSDRAGWRAWGPNLEQSLPKPPSSPRQAIWLTRK